MPLSRGGMLPVEKHGTRYEAIQALGMALRQQFGHLGAGAARGLALRHDHGGSFMSEVFQKQIRFWSMAPSSLSDLRDPVCGNRLGCVIRSWFRGSPLHEQLPPDQPRHRLSAAAIGG